MSLFSRMTLLAGLAIVPMVMRAEPASAQAFPVLPAAAYDASVPGWTGHTLVTGSRSSLAGDEAATRRDQTGAY